MITLYLLDTIFDFIVLIFRFRSADNRYLIGAKRAPCISYRLYDSLPSTKLQALKEEIAIWKRVHPEPLSWADADEYAKRFTRKIQRWLDAGSGVGSNAFY
jgi:hypothetical protein